MVKWKFLILLRLELRLLGRPVGIATGYSGQYWIKTRVTIKTRGKNYVTIFNMGQYRCFSCHKQLTSRIWTVTDFLICSKFNVTSPRLVFKTHWNINTEIMWQPVSCRMLPKDRPTLTELLRQPLQFLCVHTLHETRPSHLRLLRRVPEIQRRR
jgi:hypothetical protein